MNILPSKGDAPAPERRNPIFRLSPRGAGGLVCDTTGVALGPATLLRRGVRDGWDIAPTPVLSDVLRAAYGAQPEAVAQRVHRGLSRAARALEADDLCLAGIEIVLLALPDPTPAALERLAKFASLDKWGDAWRDEPRVPAGNREGGEWTNGDGDSRPARRPSPGDAVYRPATDPASIAPTGGAPEEAEPSRGSNGPPADFTSLEEVFPGLKDSPHVTATLEPLDDAFFGVGAAADEANLEATMGQYHSLVAEIKAVDPSFVDAELLPPGGVAGLTWEGRNNLIDGLLMQRAAAYYRMRGDVQRLQVETLRFLQKAVDAAYAEAQTAADNGRLQPRLSREEAIGNRVDSMVRGKLKDFFRAFGVPYGPQQDLTINNRDYFAAVGENMYRIPDSRLRDIVLDWTISRKTITTPQIRDFFRANSRPRAVVIVRPNQIGRNSTYLISRPIGSIP